MCYLISVSALGFSGNLTEHFRAYKLLASPTRNPTVLRALRGVPYDITDGHCSCSLYVAPGADGRVEAEINAARKRYEKAGWSQGKIDRALEAKSRSHSRTARGPSLDFPSAIGAPVLAGADVRLLCHSYSGRFDDEAFDVATTITMALDSPAFQFSSFPEDAVVILGRGNSDPAE
jgi:hypothetical protein